MAEILVFEDDEFVQNGILQIFFCGGYQLFGSFIEDTFQANAMITRAVAAGVKVAVVNGELLSYDGKMVIEMLRGNGIKSITYAQNGFENMGADVVVRNETSHTTLLSGIAHALSSLIQE